MESLSIDAIVIGAGSALVTVIGVLWRELIKHNKFHKERADKQERALEITNGRVIELSEKVGHAEGYKNGVEALASALIDEIKSAD